jgi:hypothetical protein
MIPGMRCIFCKTDSSSSNSIEHIIPQSLGNTEYVLPRGWVCDRCNNYFSRKIEKPFLESLYGTVSRFEMQVPNKKGRIPPVIGFHAESGSRVAMFYDATDGSRCVGVDEGEDESRWIAAVKGRKKGTLYFPRPEIPRGDYVTARFIAKVALEVLAFRCLDLTGWNDEIVEKIELDEIRHYVRVGNPRLIWPVHIRQIYERGHMFVDGSRSYQVLHEWTILNTQQGEFFVIVAIFGVEYSINLGGPELKGYLNWLEQNESRSPLY